MVCRTDVGNIYRWSGTVDDYEDPTKRWVPLLTNARLDAAVGGVANRGSNDYGGWEFVQAPSASDVLLAIFPDMSPAGNVYGSLIWYSDDAGETWNETNITFSGGTAQSNGPPGGDTRNCAYKIAIDPANPNVAYCGMPASSGNSAGVYTTLNQAGGSSIATWTSVKTSGATPIPATAYGISCGIVIDPSLGTTTVGGQTVTKRIILPIGGGGIYESTDGGVTFSEIAASSFGTSVFYVATGGCNYDGVYYCIAIQPSVNFTAASSWTTGNSTITMGTNAVLAPDGNPGVAAGMTVFNNTTGQSVGTVLSWVGSTLTLTGNASSASSGSSDSLTFSAPSPDVRGVWRYASGTWTDITSGTFSRSSYVLNTFMCVDPRNDADAKTYLAVWGPQGISAGFSSANANSGTPTWTGYTGGQTSFMQAASYDLGYINDIFGQGAGFTYGTSATVDAAGRCWWTGNQSLFYFGTSDSDTTARATGGPRYPNTAPDDLYYWSMARGQESTVAVDVLRPPGGPYPIMGLHDVGSPMRGTYTTYPLTMAHIQKQYACTNLEYAADDPSFVVARVTSQGANIDASCYSENYGADGTWVIPDQDPTSIYVAEGNVIIGGMTVAVDRDHWVTIPNGFGAAIQPAFTANATGAADWDFCTGLPKADWWSEPWFFGAYTPKQLAVGYGSDLGTVWACLKPVNDTTATLYRSTDSGANFTSVTSWTVSALGYSAYCLAVPGFPDELWMTSRYVGGTGDKLWHITEARTGSPPTVTAIILPDLISHPEAFTLGAPASPGGYPTLYLTGGSGFGTTQYLYQGTYSGSGDTVTWELFGTSGQTNGINPDLPDSCQLAGIQSIRGDWDVYRRLYVSARGAGFAYYNP